LPAHSRTARRGRATATAKRGSRRLLSGGVRAAQADERHAVLGRRPSPRLAAQVWRGGGPGAAAHGALLRIITETAGALVGRLGPALTGVALVAVQAPLAHAARQPFDAVRAGVTAPGTDGQGSA